MSVIRFYQDHLKRFIIVIQLKWFLYGLSAYVIVIQVFISIRNHTVGWGKIQVSVAKGTLESFSQIALLMINFNASVPFIWNARSLQRIQMYFTLSHCWKKRAF